MRTKEEKKPSVKNVKETPSAKDQTKGKTLNQGRSELDQARFELISEGLNLVGTRIAKVLKGRLSRQQRELLSEALSIVQRCRSKGL